MRFGIELLPDATRRSDLNDWLAHKVRPMFEQRVLAISEDVMFKWRLMVEDGRKAGHTFSQPDLIIAVIFPKPTRDAKPFGLVLARAAIGAPSQSNCHRFAIVAPAA